MICACIFASDPVGASNPYGPPVANWIASPPISYPFTTVYFEDLSTAIPTSWAWYFGSSSSGVLFSIEQNPNYFFTAPGTYYITLVATNEYGSSEFTDVVVINP